MHVCAGWWLLRCQGGRPPAAAGHARRLRAVGDGRHLRAAAGLGCRLGAGHTGAGGARAHGASGGPRLLPHPADGVDAAGDEARGAARCRRGATMHPCCLPACLPSPLMPGPQSFSYHHRTTFLCKPELDADFLCVRARSGSVRFTSSAPSRISRLLQRLEGGSQRKAW
eukprot:COSAG01_NODE_22591_length_849_cov_2.693333_1_plen_169_part_00